MSVYPAALPTVRPAVRSAFEQGSGGGAASIIAGLFAQGQQGFWLPFTDFASLSQDSAGTLPYTALEQPVGRVLDRSGRGNHASQVTSTARGVVSARVNLLQKTEDFSGAPWVAQRGALTSAAAPDGTMTAVLFTEDTSITLAHRFYQPVNSGGVFRMSATVKSNGRNIAFVPENIPYTNAHTAVFDLAAGTAAVLGGGSPNVTISNPTIAAKGGGWFEVAATIAIASGAFLPLIYLASGTATAYTGDGISGAFLWRPQVVAGLAETPYQRVNTPTYYDAVGFPKHLRIDGTDDFYTCGGGGSTTGFFFSDVVRPMGGAGTRRVIWSDRSGNNGYELAISASDKLELSAGNGTAITAVASTVSATVADGKRYEVMDDGTNLSVQIDGSAPVTIARPVVTAGSSTITLYRGASTGYFNGQVTEPIYRAGPPPSAYERSVIRGYQMQKAGL